MADEAVKRIIIDLIPESKPFFEVMPEYDGERQTVILDPGLVQKAFWEIIQWNKNNVSNDYVKIEGRGSTGRTIPCDVIEEIAMDNTKRNPFDPGEGNVARKIIESLNDERWKDWEKWEIVYRTKYNRNITIHFSYDPINNLFDDFKFKN